MQKIDFVVPWVDGNDPSWQKKKRQFCPEDPGQNIRYRDWDTLKYWFRGVDKNAPWVNRIILITDRQIPEWLNLKNPKLRLVDHTDYIPPEYLPTFSTHTIELNLHRISCLSDKFVYFNDDIFVMKPVTEEDFFKKGLPVDMAVLYPGITTKDQVFDHILLENADFFARHYDIRKVIAKNRLKWHHPVYGKSVLKTLAMEQFPDFTGIMMHHQPNSYLKSTLVKAWELEPELLDRVSRNRVRAKDDVNQYIFRYIQLGEGLFEPVNLFKRGAMLKLGEKSLDYDLLFANNKYKLLCLNDEADMIDYQEEKQKLVQAMDNIFHQKSSFEK